MTPRPGSLDDAVAGAARIAARLRRSMAAFDGVPVTAEAVRAQDAVMQGRSDALLKRVENLIAQIQDQVWRLVLVAEQEAGQARSRRERNEIMERLGLLGAARDFAAAAELRNRLSHEYPTEPELQARLLADALSVAPLLLDCVGRAEAYLAGRKAEPPAAAPP